MTMRRPKVIGVLLCVFPLLQGCAHITMLRTEELRQVQAHVDSLNAEIARAHVAIVKNQKRESELLRMIRADMQVRFGELDRRIAALEGGISESQARLSKIDEKTQEIRDRWAEQARIDSAESNARTAEIEKLFQIAYGDFTAGRYDLALGGFEDLITRFPESSAAEEAAYWGAECYYVQKDYAKAELRYLAYVKDYPQGKKVCAALYKLGLLYEKQKKSKHKGMVWDKLKLQCPDSEEAKAAAGRSGR
jgi:tol-pal system protein YbgF